MIEIQPTLTITVDGTTYEVADMSSEIKQMVIYLDEWRRNEAAETAALLKTRAALRDIQNMILAQIQKENSEPSEEAQEAGEASPASEEGSDDSE